MTSLSTADLTKSLLDFKQEKNKTEQFLKRNHIAYAPTHKVIPDKAFDLLKNELESEKILHPITIKELDKIFITKIKDLDLFVNRFKAFHQQVCGLPQFLDDFLSGKPSQAKEIFYKDSSQTSFIECDKNYFMIQSNPMYNDISLCDSQEKLKLFGQFTIPPRLGVWFIHSDYIKNKTHYPILEALSDKNKKNMLLKSLKKIYTKDTLALRYGEKDSSERKFADAQEDSPHVPAYLRRFSFSKVAKRHSNQETNQQREARTGQTYLSSVLFLEPQKHLDMLKHLKRNCLEHLDKIYGITQETHPELSMYFHCPYLERTSTLHLHVVCKKASTELNALLIDDIIDAFEHGGTINDVIKTQYNKIGGFAFDPEPSRTEEFFNIIGHDNIIGGKVLFMPQDST